MAKKKVKNIKLEQEELKPVTIGIFENRKRSSIGIFIILTIFVGVILFLPQISDKIDELLNPATPLPSVNPNPKPSPNPDNPSEDFSNTFYNVDSSLVIERSDIVFSNLVVDQESKAITFKVKNNTNKSFTLETLNYYLELYNNDQTLLERVKLIGQNILRGEEEQELKRPIKDTSSASLSKIVLVKKSISEYNNFELNQDEEGNGFLVCSRQEEKATYQFKENKLKEVVLELKYDGSNNSLEYEQVLEEHQRLVNSYNGQKGVLSMLIPGVLNHSIKTNVNLSEASRMYVFNADTFKLDTEAKVVKFEMEAQGFSCSNGS